MLGRRLAQAAVAAASGLAGAAGACALAGGGSRAWPAVAGLVAGGAALLAWRRRGAPRRTPGAPTILDTSVIIDGRVAGVAEAGFLDGPVVVPDFVRRELLQIADSPDALRRARGRRGLEVLAELERLPGLAVSADGRDFPGVAEVDDKLLALARATGGRIATNDVALHRRARLGGLLALSLNELADALRPAVLPGESMAVRVAKAGREPEQGVAYLDDGTMVVVDGGRPFVGRTLEVTVTSVHQTRVGRMIFARPRLEQGVAR